jgi:hypothetical protein
LWLEFAWNIAPVVPALYVFQPTFSDRRSIPNGLIEKYRWFHKDDLFLDMASKYSPYRRYGFDAEFNESDELSNNVIRGPTTARDRRICFTWL